MKRKIDKHYIFLALASILITYIGIKYSFNHRGYWAVGGEVLVVPLIFLIRFLVKSIREDWGI
ncbi:hypothetical protein [Helcococcus kunzii]|uniref:hypothetical protein n=1 Tax=Helcococcus kunzii TaxID=40091 RepID=UPI0024AE49A3|nr:hypothetical protein [Helcococcus kunzii]